jgi:putative transposase
MIVLPRYAVADVIGKMKEMIASELRKKFSCLAKVYWKENIAWSPRNFVSTIGIDEGRVLTYLRWQEIQDLGQAKIEF